MIQQHIKYIKGGINIAKYCIKCGKPIYGRARKYCEKCKRSQHLNQMSDYYKKHMDRYQYNGIYWNNRKGIQICGTGSLGSNPNTNDWEKEWSQIQQEMINLNLRNRKEKWRY